MSVLSSLKLLFLSRRYSQQLTPSGIRSATRDDQRSTDLEGGERDFRETVLHLFVGQELEGLRWKHLTEVTWKGFVRFRIVVARVGHWCLSLGAGDREG